MLEALERRALLTTYYIDAVNGSDSNPGTTVEQPFRTPRNISASTDEGNPNYRPLQAGDVVYLREGVHDWSNLLTIPQTYEDNAAFLIQGAHGTKESPITIRAYPGERPIVKARENGVSNSAIYVLQSEHVKILGLEVTGTFGPGIRVTSVRDVEIAHNYIHDVDGIAANNIAGIYTLETIALEIHHNLLHDNYDRAQANTPGELNRENNRNIVIFGEGSDQVSVHHNKVFNTPRPDLRPTGAGIWVKHASEIPGARLEFFDNIVRDVHVTGIGSHMTGIDMHHNLIVNAGPYRTTVDDDGPAMGGHRMRFNTIVGNPAFNSYGSTPGVFPSEGFLEFQNNIVVDHEQTYNIDTGIIRIEAYGTDDDYRVLVRPENLRFSDNVYFNPNTPPMWNVFMANDEANKQLGGQFTFAEWQALGVDPNSRLADPQLTDSYIPRNPSAINAGWLAGDEPRLTLYVRKDMFSETAGSTASSLTVIRSGMNLDAPLTVRLTTSDGTEVQVPGSVTIPAGVASIQVPITAMDDNRIEPTRAVQIFASATLGAVSLHGSEWVRVLQSGAAPAMSGLGGAVTYTENAALVAVASSATITDVDSPTLNGGKLVAKLTSNAQSTDRLRIRTVGNVSTAGNEIRYSGTPIGTFTGGNGTTELAISFNGQATLSRVTAVLRAIGFDHTSENPSATSRTLTLYAMDGQGNQSATLSKLIQVVPVNNAPVLTPASGSTISYQRNTSSIPCLGTASVIDPDSADFDRGKLVVQIVNGSDAGNRLVLANGFFYDGNTVKRVSDGLVVGTRNASGGIGTTRLEITFNANATKALVAQLIRGIRFRTINSASAAQRIVEFTLSDGDGGTSNKVRSTINVWS